MIKEPKYKICRRLGPGVYEKCQTQKFTLSEQKRKDTKKTRRKQVSDYGKQLLEKQKVRFTYGLRERQMVKYVKNSMAQKETTVYDKLFEVIESRLDNVVFRMGLAETRAKARQIVTHGHIVVNGKKLNIPSFSVSIGDVVGIRKQSIEKPLFAGLEEKLKGSNIPNWLSFDIKKKEGKIAGLPKAGVGESFDLRAVFEYYSR
ncbi:30S ribosomal protein S4 [Patescibacteria group bacterium]|nr:30S ribosomal protein S4 [Patescibacteria group bacterium]MCG2694573.1 30S ribosomal protein S4 [Candidatus Parcubacteria bacterium]